MTIIKLLRDSPWGKLRFVWKPLNDGSLVMFIYGPGDLLLGSAIEPPGYGYDHVGSSSELGPLN